MNQTNVYVILYKKENRVFAVELTRQDARKRKLPWECIKQFKLDLNAGKEVR